MTHPTMVQGDIFYHPSISVSYPLQVKTVQQVHDVLGAGVEVSLVVFVRDVPAEGTKLASLLHGGVEEGHGVVHGLPLREVGEVQSLLAGVGVGSLQTSLDALWGLKRVLDGGLEEVDGVFVMDLSGQPETEVIVTLLSLQDGFEKLIQEIQCQVSVLQQSPASLE